ncbi:MAG: hypothetical protein AVDCRST_MAG59-3389, partial [uncultured Thermomicrobiales bacterium]
RREAGGPAAAPRGRRRLAGRRRAAGGTGHRLRRPRGRRAV